MKKKIISTLLAVILALTAIVFVSGCGPVQIGDYTLHLEDIAKLFNESSQQAFTGDGTFKSYYLNVGQGDSEFIELPDGKTMLIDASELEYGSKIKDFIKEQGISSIDYVVITHPHSDHFGGMKTILTSFDIGKIYMPDAVNDTSSFNNLLKTIQSENIKVEQAKAGMTILNENGLDIEIIAPNSDEYEDLNNYSAVVKITYGNTSFLYMGDAESESEKEITSDVSCDVIKVGHHGSKTSSSAAFVKRVKPEYAVVSVGAGNSYGLPKDEILKRWKDIGAQILRTDEEGTIAFSSDGNSVERIQ